MALTDREFADELVRRVNALISTRHERLCFEELMRTTAAADVTGPRVTTHRRNLLGILNSLIQQDPTVLDRDKDTLAVTYNAQTGQIEAAARQTGVPRDDDGTPIGSPARK